MGSTVAKLTLRRIADALAGEVVGGQVLAPGPGRDARDRSLSVMLSDRNEAGFFAVSRSGDDWRDCRDHIRARLGLAQYEDPGERYVPDHLRHDRMTALDLDDAKEEAAMRRRLGI